MAGTPHWFSDSTMRTTLAEDGIPLTPEFRKAARETVRLYLGGHAATLRSVTIRASRDEATRQVRVELRLEALDSELTSLSSLARTPEEALERSLARAARALHVRKPMERSKPWTPKR